MVKHKRGIRTRLILGIVAVLVTGGAIAVGIATNQSQTHRRVQPPPAPYPSNTRALATAPANTPRPQPSPLGVPGHWKLVFDDEFNGGSLDQTVWNAHDGWTGQNGVTDRLANVTVRDGHAILTLASAGSGAEIGTRDFGLKVGEYAEARIDFAGRGSTIYNWPAFWTSGPSWPHGGENDIAEGFGVLTVNYHSPQVTYMSGRIPGEYAGGFHVYGIYRGSGYARVYWDGKVVGAYSTADNGQPQTLLLTLGAANHIVTGTAGAMIVDYVRAWAPS